MITGLAFPDAQVRMFFDGAPPFSIKWAIYGGVGFDILGVIYGWRYGLFSLYPGNYRLFFVSLTVDFASMRRRFDHVAHLGGALFGAMYFSYGMQFWDWLRSALWDSVMEEGFKEASKSMGWSDDESEK